MKISGYLITLSSVAFFPFALSNIINEYHPDLKSDRKLFELREDVPLEDQETTNMPPDFTILDTKADIQPFPYNFWSTSNEFKHYLEYYNSTIDFKKQSANNFTCSYYMNNEKRDSLGETNGIWVACQDQTQPSECANTGDTTACNPSIKYDRRTFITQKIRTVIGTFAVETFGILRITVKGNCSDYAKRKDPFSVCEFYQINNSGNTQGWNRFVFNFYPDFNVAFNDFTVDLLARFELDLVLVDMIEASKDLICANDVLCATEPTTTSQTFTTTLPSTPTNPDPIATTSSTPEPIVTDPYDEDTTEAHGSSSIHISTISLSSIYICFGILYPLINQL